METGILILALVLIAAGGLSVLLGRWSITLPIVFVAAGVIINAVGLLDLSPSHEAVRTLTELTLVMLLFADASTLSVTQIREDAGLPTRLLGIGLPMTITAGALVAWLLFPQEGLGFALLLATILAPTDAALGLPIFINPRVPVRIRRALNVESGLNDGLATPFITLFIALAISQERTGQGTWLTVALVQIALAVLAGVVVGGLGGWLLLQARQRQWTTGAPLQFAVLGVALATYLAALLIGGNGFVAAFVGGMTFRRLTGGKLAEAAEYTEATGTLLSLFVWTIFGIVFVVPFVLTDFDWRPVVYAVISLTAVRMLPVALALRSKRLRPDTLAIMGWFGPRGLASVIFALMAMDALEGAGMEFGLLASTAAWTILLSVLVHGLSAQPLAGWYANRLRAAGPDLPELEDMSELRNRHRTLIGTEAGQALEQTPS
jgi:NhaP-type Na+/H+ or K+/H+ antiporter